MKSSLSVEAHTRIPISTYVILWFDINRLLEFQVSVIIFLNMNMSGLSSAIICDEI